MTQNANDSVYARITNRILEALERGVVPWEKPWISGEHRSAITGTPYRGINVLQLELTALEKGYRDSRWITFKQATRLGGHLRHGERGTTCVWYKPLTRQTTDADDVAEEQRGRILLARTFVLFNVEQYGDLGAPLHERPSLFHPVQRCEEVVARSGATIEYGGDRAYYDPTRDCIGMPPHESFIRPEDQAAVAFHELVHFSGAPHRLNRDLSGRFGDPFYAFEELVAELGAAFLCARCGVEHVGQSAAYIDSWIRVLKRDTRALFTAARLASEASDFPMPRETEPALDDRAA